MDWKAEQEWKEEKIRLYRTDHPHQLWLIIFAGYLEHKWTYLF